jgi:hypothetical protein
LKNAPLYFSLTHHTLASGSLKFKPHLYGLRSLALLTSTPNCLQLPSPTSFYPTTQFNTCPNTGPSKKPPSSGYSLPIVNIKLRCSVALNHPSMPVNGIRYPSSSIPSALKASTPDPSGLQAQPLLVSSNELGPGVEAPSPLSWP